MGRMLHAVFLARIPIEQMGIIQQELSRIQEVI